MEPEEKSETDASQPEVGDNEDHLSLEIAKSNVSIAQTLSPIHEFFFVGTVCLAQLMTQVSLGQTIALLHVIGRSFDIQNPSQLTWLIAGYSLTVGTFILVSGRLGDVYGYKKMVLIGFSWFSFWSMVCGVSVYSTKVLFIFSRVMAGIGPSLCLPNAIAILGSSYNPGPRKNMVFSIFGAVAPGGGAIGSAFGGLFALAWWPWAYWSTAIALAGITVLGYFVLPNPPPKTQASNLSFRGHMERLDVLGAFVGVTALVLINFAWNQAPGVGWSDPYVYIVLIIGFALVALFFYIELRISTSPLLPFEALNGDVAFVLGCIACGWGTFGVWYFYYWQIILVLRGVDPLLGAAYFSPAVIAGACAALLTGYLLSRWRPAWVMVCAMCAFVTGSILLATVPVHQVYWAQFFVAVIVAPFGMDMSFPSGTLILSNAVSKKHQGIAASLVNTVVNYSISLALGFAGTVEVQIEGGDMSPEGLLRGYRSALYLAVGLSGFGLALSLMFLLKGYVQDARKAKAVGTRHDKGDA